MESQRVVVIQDASRGVSLSAIRWALRGLSLKPGDMLTLLSVLHQVNNPSTLSFRGAGKLMGYKSRVDTSMFGSNRKIVDEELARKRKEYQNDEELTQISELYEMQKIEFKFEVDAGPSPKEVALEAAKKLGATWVILDRQMKKDKKYFLERLSCGISRMKRDDNIEELRGPKAKVENNRFLKERNRIMQVTYDEMLPGSIEGDDLFSLELVPSSQGSIESTWSGFSDEKNSSNQNLLKNNTNIKKETVKKAPFKANPSKLEVDSIEEAQGLLIKSWNAEELFDNSVCKICKNRRPTIGFNRDFTYLELRAATNGFSPKNVISDGQYGTLFRGHMKDGSIVAIKDYKDASFHGGQRIKSEVKVLSKIRHKNVVMMVGTCSEGGLKLLVYEYVCNGTLDQHLKKHSSQTLTWEERMKIAVGASSGLNHLHENTIIHRDVRPNNIFVTHDHETLLGGFGVAIEQNDSDQSLDQRVLGTFGYLAPEYTESGKASPKTDVYSFGVVLLELITGQTTTDKILEGKSLLGWARPLLKERNYVELIDQTIVNSHDVHKSIWMFQVAEKCLNKDPLKRLSMDKVVFALENILEGKAPWGREKESEAKSDALINMLKLDGSYQDYEETFAKTP